MTLYRSKQVLLESGLQTAGILVGQDGKIDRILTGELLNSCDDLERTMFTEMSLFKVTPPATTVPMFQVVDVDDLVIMAGVVDSHVHVNEPGRTDWEGYWSATRAAAAGGVTTIVDMPLNSIPSTTTVSNLQTKLKAAQGQTHVDVAFWGGVIPGNQDELRGLVDAGVVGFKCFLCPSGVDEFPHVSLSDVETALHQLQGTSSLLAFHAECDLDLEDKERSDDPCQYQTFLNSRPPAMEVEAIRIVTQLCLKYSVRCHIVHLSAAEALPLVHAAKQQGALLTAETCHHYLTLAAEEVPNCATQYKCCPPVRGQLNRELLWKALYEGDLDMVVSDHSPCTPDLKKLEQGDFLSAWGGISSLQFGLSLFWTEARLRGFTFLDVTRLLSSAPAKLCGLQDRKGCLKEGMDADLVIWDPFRSFQVEISQIQHKNKVTPYLGKTLYGVVMRTIVRGNMVYQHDKPFPRPQGKLLIPPQL
uniref:allantoinase n=1 Tax=Timema bartmani TaxID=61472 RepID=A0A7R9F592_9NEOP|nr:unnamed protein product [Timema bartmani]